MNPIQKALCLALRGYQLVVSPVLTSLFAPSGLGCRYTPTCSAYAMEAVRRHGALRGSCLAAGRLCRCHPWGGSGHDPVPDAGSPNFSATATAPTGAFPTPLH